MLVIRYTTRGTEVYEDELGPTIGYDDCETDFAIVPDEDGALESWYDPETYSSLEVVCSQPTLGM